jgi:hypothetical protein
MSHGSPKCKSAIFSNPILLLYFVTIEEPLKESLRKELFWMRGEELKQLIVGGVDKKRGEVWSCAKMGRYEDQV